jgi:hypothetical protein
MDHPEMSPGSEPATPEELRGLYELAEGWLLAHGTNSHALGSKLFGSHDGVDITDQQPQFSYLLTADEARNISSDAVETLRIGGNFEMNFCHECYIRNAQEPDGLQYEAPILMFHITHPQSEPIAATTLSIEIDENSEPVSYRTEEESANLPRQSDPSIEERFSEIMERVKLEHATGYYQLARSEVSALRTLLEGVIANPPTPPAIG